MYFDQMNDLQRSEEALFVEGLSRAGWNAKAISDRLHAGTLMHPEGRAVFDRGEDRKLFLTYYAAERALALRISWQREDHYVRLKFLYSDNMKAVLDWVVRHQLDFGPDSFAEYLKEIIPVCEKVFFISDDGEQFLLGLED